MLLFWSLDRLSREGTVETLNHLQRLTGYGVNYRSFTEQYLDSTGNPFYSLQFVGVQREAGDVTYFSHVYQCSWWNNCSNPADYYSWNTSAGPPPWGTLLALSTTWGAGVGSRRFGKNACRKF